MKKLWSSVFLTIALAEVSAIAQTIPTSPTQAPNVTPQSSRPGNPPARPQQNRSMVAAPAPATGLHAPYTGTLEGYVYWNTSAVQHNPASACNGLAVTVGIGTPPKGPNPTFETFTSIGTFNTFTYVNNGSSLGACAYAVKVPVGADLQVQVAAASSSFSQSVVPVTPPTANDPNGPIKIVSGKCNNLPPAVPSPQVLGSHWWTCGNYAYNVNFLLQAPGPTQLMSAGSGLQPLLSRASGGTQNSSGGTLTPLIPRGAPGSQSQGSSGPVPGQRSQQLNPNREALTNADVLKMVRNGVPETVIVSSIQSSRKNFNLGPDGCSDLRRARVSAKVLGAMGDGGKRRCLTGSVRATTKLSAPKQTSKITNPKARQQQTAIIAVLQKQRTAADAEAAQMKLGIRPAAVQVQPSQTMSATGTGGMTSSPGAVQPAPLAGRNSLAGNSQLVSRFAKLPFFNNLAITCAHDPTMRVLTVSGGPSPVIFTPDPKYNFYTITGCSFGNPGTNSKAYIYYQGTFREDFQIDQWTDNTIQLSLDPSISGVDDQSNITFVIQREDGTQAAKAGYSFYAVRQTVLLSQIPKSDFSLYQFRPDNSILSTWKPTYTSGSSASVTPNLPGLSAEVHWDISYETDGSVTGGSDIYDFSHLHSTFALDSTSLEYANLSCTDPDFNQFTVSKGYNWSIDWYGSSGIQVGWQGQVCNNTPGSCGGFMQGDCFQRMPESNYGINVWVTGPRGLDPWTGKPLG